MHMIFAMLLKWMKAGIKAEICFTNLMLLKRSKRTSSEICPLSDAIRGLFVTLTSVVSVLWCSLKLLKILKIGKWLVHHCEDSHKPIGNHSLKIVVTIGRLEISLSLAKTSGSRVGFWRRGLITATWMTVVHSLLAETSQFYLG